MSAYYRNDGYEEDPNYPEYSESWNRTQGYLKTQDYPYSPGPLNNSDFSKTRSDPYSAGSRSSDYPKSLAKPDYIGSWSSPYQPGLSREPDYSESQQNPDFVGSRSSGNYAGSRTDVAYLGSFGEPDYPGAQGNSNRPGSRVSSNHPGSRRNPEYAGSRIKPYRDTLGESDDLDTTNRPNFSNSFGKPDYPNAEDYRNSPNFWGEPDYPNAEDARDYGYSETPQMTREVLSRTSSIQPSSPHGGDGPLGILVRENEYYPESIEMRSMEMSNPYGHSVSGAPSSGYVNPAYVGESSPGPAYGIPLYGGDWYKSPQGQKLIASLIAMTSRDRMKAIRNQPRTMEEKRNLRKMVDKEKSKQPHRTLELSCCTQCLNSISLVSRPLLPSAKGAREGGNGEMGEWG